MAHRNSSEYLRHSQNYLTNPQLVHSLIALSDIGNADTVIEIGPGKGIITAGLASQAAQVIAVELDPHHAAKLRELFGPQSIIQIIEHDFMSWELPVTPYKVFANIPFSSTAAIMRKLLFSANPPQSTYVVIQADAAAKYFPKPGQVVSQLSVLLYPFFDGSVLKRINRRSFYPIPGVDAAFVRIVRRSAPFISVTLRDLFTDFVVFGFNQWQPTVALSYRTVFSNSEITVLDRDLSITTMRPSQFTAPKWLTLFQFFTTRLPANRQASVIGAESRLREKQKTMVKIHRRYSR